MVKPPRFALFAVAVGLALVFFVRARFERPPVASSETAPAARSAPSAAPVPAETPAPLASNAHAGAISRTEPLSAPSPEKAPENDPFRASIDRARSALPRATEVRQRIEKSGAEAAHGVPGEVVEAGRTIGAVLETLREHPEGTREAARFFLECAEDAEVLPSIRALCYQHARERETILSAPERARVAGIPEAIRSLAAKLGP